MARLTVVCFQETDARKWVAQCLEYDICASAESLAELPTAFHAAVEGHELICEAEGIQPLVSLPPAPRRYWKMAQEAVGTFEPNAPLPLRVAHQSVAPPRYALASPFPRYAEAAPPERYAEAS